MENKIVMVEKEELNIHTLTDDEIELLAWFRLLDERNQLKAISKVENMAKEEVTKDINNKAHNMFIQISNIKKKSNI